MESANQTADSVDSAVDSANQNADSAPFYVESKS